MAYSPAMEKHVVITVIGVCFGSFTTSGWSVDVQSGASSQRFVLNGDFYEHFIEWL